jgi:peptide deformylase
MKIVRYPHPSLRHPAKPLTAIDKRVQVFVGEMLDLMYEAKGLGLAAPQVALPYQVFVMNPEADPEHRERELVCINPVILERKGGLVEGEEGCLSFPGLYKKVKRARTVRMQAYNLKGEAFELNSSDALMSRIVQHEVDHLHGTLFIDKMGTLAKFSSRGALEEFEREYKRAQEKGEIPPDAEIEKMLRELEEQA